MQKHWDVMRSDDGGDSWQEVSGNLPTDFGFAIDVHAHEPETIYVVPIKSDSEHYPPDGKLRVFRSRTGGNDWEPLAKGLPLARVDGDVTLDIDGPVTQRSVLDALEASYPVLRGTMRDQLTHRRRPFVRFFACEQDLSHESPDAPLPDAVATGTEPFFVVGALAGG
jgi:hypothetical protein